MERLLANVEKLIDARIVKIKQVQCKDELAKCYCATADNTKRYCVKRINLKPDKVRLYENIIYGDINGFVHVYDMFHTAQKNEYIIVTDWIEGNIPNLDYWNMDRESCIHMIHIAADAIRNIHKLFRIETNLHYDDQMLRKTMEYNFLSAEQQEILYHYMESKLELINGRKATVIHGDLHIDNICGTSDRIYFIDLDDVDYGDAYNDLVYAANIHKSPEEDIIYYKFLKTYFNNDIPDEFWSIVNCYSILKILNIMNAEIAQSNTGQAIVSIDTFIEEHDKMQSDIPLWFKRMERKMMDANGNKES